MRTSVSLEPISTGTQVSVTCVDTMGFGIKAGTRTKYQRGFEERIEGLRDALSKGQPIQDHAGPDIR